MTTDNRDWLVLTKCTVIKQTVVYGCDEQKAAEYSQRHPHLGSEIKVEKCKVLEVKEIKYRL